MSNFKITFMRSNYFVITIMLFSFLSLKAQHYCLRFSKEGQKDFVLPEGKNISFIVKNSDEWNEGNLLRITPDSIFIERSITIDDLLTDRENNYVINGYELADFKVIAFKKTSKIIEGTAIAIVSLATFVLSYGTLLPADEINEHPSKKIFKKNVDFDEGWKAEVINDEIR